MRAIRPASLLLLVCCGCGTTFFLRDRILDEQGNPIPGAVVYFEVFKPTDNGRHVNFEFAVADADGWAPPKSQPALELNMPWGTCSLDSIMAPGKVSMTIMERWPCRQGKGGRHEGERKFEKDYQHEWDLVNSDFPFLDDPSLRKKASSPQAAQLRKLMREAAERLQNEKMLRALDELSRSR